MKKQMYRQGDVMVVAIPTIPTTAQPIEREEGRVILAHGEVTGHAHALCEPGVVKLADGIEEYLRVADEKADLVHEEHTTIALPPGDYRILRQQEYVPQDIPRRVAD